MFVLRQHKLVKMDLVLPPSKANIISDGKTRIFGGISHTRSTF